jgi:hypothetical protein
MPLTYTDPFSGAEASACAYTTAAKAKSAEALKPQGMSESDWEFSKKEAQWGVAQGKFLESGLQPGTVFAKGVWDGDKAFYSWNADGSIQEKFFMGKGAPEINKISHQNFKLNMVHDPDISFLDAEGGLFEKGVTSKPGVGKLTDEDVSAMFVKVKDDFAKYKGIDIKAASFLDKEVFESLAKFTGYDSAAIEAKIERYKASGKKLSSLKKQVLSGKKIVATPPPPGSSQEVMDAFEKKVLKPNHIDASLHPTIETVNKTVDDLIAKTNPAYTDEEIVKQYIKAKDSLAANPDLKWTVNTPVTKDFADEILFMMNQAGMDLNYYSDVEKAIANYVGSGKKISALKKKMATAGELDPASAAAKAAKAQAKAEKAAAAEAKSIAEQIAEDVGQKAEAAYTPGVASVMTPEVDAFTYQNLKNELYASMQPYSAYSKFANAVDELKYGGHGEFSILDVMRSYDIQKAKALGIENGFFYEKKVAEWASTSEGEQWILDAKANALANAAQKAKDAAEAHAKKIAQQEYAAAKAKVMAEMPDLPPDSALFQVISHDEAVAMQERHGRWGQAQIDALRTWSGGSYSAISRSMRGSFGTGIAPTEGLGGKYSTSIIDMQSGMKPIERELLAHRGASLEQFSAASEEELYSMIGKELEDKGFYATSVGGHSAMGGQLTIETEIPAGTFGAYIDTISTHQGEHELLLAAGTRFKVLRIEEGYGKMVVRVRAIPGSHVRAETMIPKPNTSRFGAW